MARLTGLVLLYCALVSGCDSAQWNNPYPASQQGGNILYSSFSSRPKHLDPVRAYSTNEFSFIGQIYEPALQYHYLKHPYQLAPLTAAQMPQLTYLDAAGRELPVDTPVETIAYSVYEIQIRPEIHYQPHPAFARDEQGVLHYQQLSEDDLVNVRELGDFAHLGSRELVAADYVYQIKRLAHPRLHSPIQGLMSEHIVGLKAYAATLAEAYAEQIEKDPSNRWLDLRQFDLPGLEVVDDYTYRITIQGKYPQLRYWLAMPFFAPMPWEAERFYAQPGMQERNISLDWYPVGTGAYMLTVNNPNRQMILERNPYFHPQYYPTEGDPGDAEQGLLDDAGKPLPFIDKVVYSLEKEDIPYWNKFLQGYYDVSGVTSDSFDQAIQFGSQGDAVLTQLLEYKGIKLLTAVQASTFYMGFNMLDPVVGGDNERARFLRHAISIAVDYEDFISIFANGRGIAAQSAIPPGIFGHVEGQAGINPYVYEWRDGRAQRKPIYEAKRLLAQAGYPNGRDAETGKPLLIHLDITGGGPEDKAVFDWLRKQFRKIDLELVIRNTDYNRFKEKMRNGNAQLFQWGWHADYPDPENFLFLLYGPNGKVRHGGENAANYDSPEFNRLFNTMKNMDDSQERFGIIQQMNAIAQHDAPWLWGFHPKEFILHHGWFSNVKPNLMARNTLMYQRIDPQLREQSRRVWNRPVVWPVLVVLVILLVGIIPAVITYRRKERAAARQRVSQ